jgi:hypothetical protein
MGNLSEETIRKTLNAASVVTGSKVSSASSALASATATDYTGGIVLTNASVTAAETIWFSTTGAAAVNGAASSILHAGASKPIAWGDLNTLRFIAGSGTPYLTWEGTTL